jgi:hypothetical protein
LSADTVEARTAHNEVRTRFHPALPDLRVTRTRDRNLTRVFHPGPSFLVCMTLEQRELLVFYAG